MKVSEFLENQKIPAFLLGAFYGRFQFTKDYKYIYTYSSYKNSVLYRNSRLCIQSKKDYLNQLNEICQPYSFWSKSSSGFPRTDIVFSLRNDLNLTKEQFFNRLNTKIYNTDFIYEEKLSENKKSFIRGFCELRASIDRNRKLLTMDYVYNNTQEAKRVRLLIDYLDVPVNVANYNFREFQNDYINGIKRETQFRINIMWYANYIGFINTYKIEVFKNNFDFTEIYKVKDVTYFKCELPINSENTNFENRLAYYTNNVFGKKLTKLDLDKFKKLIGANNDSQDFRRNFNIVNAVRYGTDDFCVCCCDDYNIKNRSFMERNTGRFHFEIHHMISVGKTKELDDVDNLAKICPSCHATLKRGSANELTQKECIRKIFKHKANILEFCKSYFDEQDYETVVDLVWKALK